MHLIQDIVQSHAVDCENIKANRIEHQSTYVIQELFYLHQM
jgi:hypothetical protein